MASTSAISQAITINLSDGTNVAYPNSGSRRLVLDEWVHALVVIDRESDFGTWYIDGVKQPSTDISSIGSIDCSGADTYMNVGSGAGQNHNFNGLLDDFRVYDRALSEDEITRLYQLGEGVKVASTPAATGSLADGLVGHWTFDGQDMDWSSTTAEVRDRSGNGNHGDVVVLLTPLEFVSGKHGQALRFYSSASTTVPDQQILMEPDSSLNVTSVTVSAWIRVNEYKSGQIQQIVNHYDDVGFLGYDLHISTSKRLHFIIGDEDGSGGGWERYETELDEGEWYHVVATYDSGTSEMKAYIDGLEDTPVSSGTTPPTGNIGVDSDRLRIGDRGVHFLRHLLADLDDVRIYNRSLSADEVKRLYQMGEGTKVATTPNISASPLEQGLVGHWTFDGPDVDWSSTTAEIEDRSGNGNHGDAQGGMSTQSVTGGPVGQAMSFDGVNDYVSSSIDLSGTNHVTLSIWMKKNFVNLTPNDYRNLFEATANFNGNSTGFIITDDDTACSQELSVGLKGDAGYSIGCYTRPSTNEWHHYVAVFDKSKTTEEIDLYIDGSLQSPSGRPFNFNNGNNFDVVPIFIASRGGSIAHNDADLDDVRIYNRALSASEVQQLYQLGR